MIKVIDFFTSDYRPVADLVMPSHTAFCQRHGYEHLICEHLLDPAVHPVWNRIPLYVREYQPDDVLIMIDSDVLILDPDFDLTPYFPKNGINFSTDLNGLCAGFFIGHGPWAKKFLETAFFLGDSVDDLKFREQTTFKVLQAHWTSVSDHLGFIPEHVVNNPRSTFVEKPFAFHFWSNSWFKSGGVDHMLTGIRRIQTEGWNPENLKAYWPW